MFSPLLVMLESLQTGICHFGLVFTDLSGSQFPEGSKHFSVEILGNEFVKEVDWGDSSDSVAPLNPSFRSSEVQNGAKKKPTNSHIFGLQRTCGPLNDMLRSVFPPLHRRSSQFGGTHVFETWREHLGWTSAAYHITSRGGRGGGRPELAKRGPLWWRRLQNFF